MILGGDRQPMTREYLRMFREFDIEEVKEHLLILGDLSADCGRCRAIGIEPHRADRCPECGTNFTFATSRRMEMHPEERFRIARRYLENKPQMIFIDFQDYQKTIGQKRARDFFA